MSMYPGMPGFSEEGEPWPRDENWPLAIGKVTGFRWWNLTISFTMRYAVRRPSPAQDILATLFDPGARIASAPFTLATQRGTPECTDTPVLSGMFSQPWEIPGDGWVQAECLRKIVAPWLLPGGTFTLPPGTFALPGVAQEAQDAAHEPPGPPPCACGIWAYWACPAPDEFRLATCASESPYGMELVVPVLGAICGAGRVVIGQRGFRCGKARVIAVAPAPFPFDCSPYSHLALTHGAPARWLSPRTAPAEALAKRLEVTPGDARDLIARQLRRTVPGARVLPRALDVLRTVAPDKQYGSPASAYDAGCVPGWLASL